MAETNLSVRWPLALNFEPRANLWLPWALHRVRRDEEIGQIQTGRQLESLWLVLPMRADRIPENRPSRLKSGAKPVTPVSSFDCFHFVSSRLPYSHQYHFARSDCLVGVGQLT